MLGLQFTVTNKIYKLKPSELLDRTMSKSKLDRNNHLSSFDTILKTWPKNVHKKKISSKSLKNLLKNLAMVLKKSLAKIFNFWQNIEQCVGIKLPTRKAY